MILQNVFKKKLLF